MTFKNHVEEVLKDEINKTIRQQGYILETEELSKKGDADMPDERKQVIEEINKEIEGISNIAKIRFILGIVRSYKNDIDNK